MPAISLKQIKGLNLGTLKADLIDVFDKLDDIQSSAGKLEIVQSFNDLPAIGDSNSLYLVVTNVNFDNKPTLYVYRNSDYVLAGGSSTGETGSGTGITIQQVTKLGVVATPLIPKVVNIDITDDGYFKRLSVEVLKFKPAEQDLTTVMCEFNNGDSTDFEENMYIEFDGTMHLKKKFYLEAVDEGILGTGQVHSRVIDFSQFESITNIAFVAI